MWPVILSSWLKFIVCQQSVKCFVQSSELSCTGCEFGEWISNILICIIILLNSHKSHDILIDDLHMSLYMKEMMALNWFQPVFHLNHNCRLIYMVFLWICCVACYISKCLTYDKKYFIKISYKICRILTCHNTQWHVYFILASNLSGKEKCLHVVLLSLASQSDFQNKIWQASGLFPSLWQAFRYQSVSCFCQFKV